MEIEDLIHAVQTLNTEDAFRLRVGLDQWRTFGQYLTMHDIRAGDLLIRQGDTERAMYFIGSGSLQVFVTPAKPSVPGTNRVAILRAGSVIGEPALFAELPRTANVEAMTPCVTWALRGPRLDELTQRSPALALAAVRAAGAVMAVRMRASIMLGVPTT